MSYQIPFLSEVCLCQYLFSTDVLFFSSVCTHVPMILSLVTPRLKFFLSICPFSKNTADCVHHQSRSPNFWPITCCRLNYCVSVRERSVCMLKSSLSGEILSFTKEVMTCVKVNDFSQCSFLILRYSARRRSLRFYFTPRPTLAFLFSTCNPCQTRGTTEVSPPAKTLPRSEGPIEGRCYTSARLHCWPCPEIWPHVSRCSQTCTLDLSRLKTTTETIGEGLILGCRSGLHPEWGFLSW